MTHPSTSALRIAETLTDCNIPQKTPQHAAMRQARINTEASFLDRVAEAGDLDLDQVFRAMAVKHAKDHLVNETTNVTDNVES